MPIIFRYFLYGQMLTKVCIFRPDGVGTVTHEEKDKFQEIKERLRVHLEFQITNFRYFEWSSTVVGWISVSNRCCVWADVRSCFPFGRPEGALKATLSLMERVNTDEEISNQLTAWVNINLVFWGIGPDEGYYDSSPARRSACRHQKVSGERGTH